MSPKTRPARRSQLPIYAPTGELTVGRLANLGKNHWTFDPILGANWFNPKIGLEVTAIVGFAMATRNPDTDYQNGVVFHAKGTIAQYMPLSKSTTTGVGCNWLYYQQINGDSGSGDRLGPFKGRVGGVGLSITIVQTVGKVQLYRQVKWLP